MNKFVLSIALVAAANVAVASTSTTVAPDASAVTAAAPAATTSTSVKKVGALPPKWSATAYVSAGLDHKDYAAGNTSANVGDIYLEAKKDIGKGHSIAIRPTFLRNQTDKSRDDEIDYYDTYLLWSAKNYFGSTLRTNIPTGEWSRKIGRHEIRHDMGVDLATFDRFTVSYFQAARAYAYTADKSGQRSWRWEGDLGVSYKVNDMVSPFAFAKYEANWRNSGAPRGMDLRVAQADTTENFIGQYMLEIGASITPTKNIYIEPSINHTRNARSEAAIDLFNAKETSYELEVSFSL